MSRAVESGRRVEGERLTVVSVTRRHYDEVRVVSCKVGARVERLDDVCAVGLKVV